MRRAILLALLVATVAACAPNTGSASAKPLVLATTTIFADMAKNVGGDRVTVESIVPAGSHVEEYEPKPEDSKKVAQASLFFQNGLDLDKWAEPLLRDRKKEASVITLTDGLPAIDNGNPHMWFDVQRARKYVEKMRDALIALDGAGKQYYTDRAKAYGLEILGFAQIEPGKDPTPAELAELVRKVKAAGVPAIFSEVGVSDAVAQTLAKEAGVTKVVTDLPTDSIAAPPTDSYIGVVRAVAQKISEALR